MTQYGEVMVKCGGNSTSWIMPVSRVVRELGMKFEWSRPGGRLLDVDGSEIGTIEEEGLLFLPWDAFRPTRDRLIASHQKGRAMCPTAVAMTMTAEAHVGDGDGGLYPVEENWKGWLMAKGKLNEPLADDAEWMKLMACRAEMYNKECGECLEVAGVRTATQEGRILRRVGDER